MRGKMLSLAFFMGIMALLLGGACGWCLCAAWGDEKRKEIVCNSDEIVKIVDRRLTSYEERSRRDLDCFMSGVKCRW